MRQFNAITKSFQSSIPQTWSQRKINCHQKFTDVLRRRKWGRRLIYQAMQSNITLKAFWRGMTEQNPSNSLTQLKLSWGLYSVSFETTFAKAGVGASRIARACSLGPVDLQLSLEFPPQLRVQMCGVPNMQRCPDPVLSRLNWETPKRSSLKSCLVLGLKLRRLSVKIIPHKQWESPRWSPNNYSSKIRTGEVYISN